MGDLTKNFSRKEFACKCGCGADNINLIFVQKLQKLREEYAKPIIISSGVRCVAHNRELGTCSFDSNSAHIKGLAVDIMIKSSDLYGSDGDKERYQLLFFILKTGLMRVGVYVKFIHVDISYNNKLFPALW